jgi:hypothetical protein
MNKSNVQLQKKGLQMSLCTFCMKIDFLYASMSQASPRFDFPGIPFSHGTPT